MTVEDSLKNYKIYLKGKIKFRDYLEFFLNREIKYFVFQKPQNFIPVKFNSFEFGFWKFQSKHTKIQEINIKIFKNREFNTREMQCLLRYMKSNFEILYKYNLLAPFIKENT